MERREFLKEAGAIVATIAAAPGIKSLIDSEEIPKLFRRKVQQLIQRAHKIGFDLSLSTLRIVMTADMWDCVSRAYACCANEKERWSFLQDRMALPFYGHWVSVVIDNSIPVVPDHVHGFSSAIYFLTDESEYEARLGL